MTTEKFVVLKEWPDGHVEIETFESQRLAMQFYWSDEKVAPKLSNYAHLTEPESPPTPIFSLF